MDNRILGFHHITAIASSAKANLEFYTKVLGLRLVKKTVNFDDPGTYHLYYADETGTPGSVITFFPWEGMSRGRTGAGMATAIGYSVPADSMDFWVKRFEKYNAIYNKPSEKFGERYLTVLDPDGLKLELTASNIEDKRKSFVTDEVDTNVGIKGFKNITVTLKSIKDTASILIDIFGYKLREESVNRFRFATDALDTANFVDLVEMPSEHKGSVAAGNIHHVAFRVKDEETLMFFRNKVIQAGYNITQKIDRNYFYSLYFREPGGVLFEIATDNPGFGVDEEFSKLGSSLMLPPQYEPRRSEIEKALPKLY